MSTATTLTEPTPAAAPRGPGPVQPQPVTLARVITAEWIKFRTLRSSWAVLGLAMLGMLTLALVIAYNTRHLSPSIAAEDAAPSATLQGLELAELLIGALGVLFVSGEYSTGMIRSTLAAVPKRLPVLWAKLIVFLTVTALAMTAISLIAFLSAQAVLSRYRTGYSLTDPGVWRVVLATGVYLTLIGLLGSALGWIVRSTPGALVTYFGVLLILPVIFGNLLGTWGQNISQFLPSDAGHSFTASLHHAPSLTPLAGLAVLATWTAAGIATAALVLRHRDA